jgi:methyl-accepting chemotaxis protein
MENIALFDPEGDPGPAVKKERFRELGCRLQQKAMIFGALLILMASGLSIGAIYHHNRGEVAANTVGLALNGPTSAATAWAAAQTDAARSHAGLEDGLTVMALALVGGLVAFMFFFIRHIVRPLSELENMTREMADGRLDRLVANSRKAGGPIAAIGENVNTMAMNLQEVLLLVWNFSEHNLATVEKTLATLAAAGEIPREQLRGELQTIQSELQQMRDLAQQFELFDVTLQGKKALAKDEHTSCQPY